jgi:hypothetical protein
MTLPGLELQSLSRPDRSQSLYWLRYPGSFDWRDWGKLWNISVKTIAAQAKTRTGISIVTACLVWRRVVWSTLPTFRSSMLCPSSGFMTLPLESTSVTISSFVSLTSPFGQWPFKGPLFPCLVLARPGPSFLPFTPRNCQQRANLLRKVTILEHGKFYWRPLSKTAQPYGGDLPCYALLPWLQMDAFRAEEGPDGTGCVVRQRRLYVYSHAQGSCNNA